MPALSLGNGGRPRRLDGICTCGASRPGPAPAGGTVGIRDGGRFGRFTTGGFGGVTVILGGVGTRSAALAAWAMAAKAKQKQPTLRQLNVRFAVMRSLSRAVATIQPPLLVLRGGLRTYLQQIVRKFNGRKF